MKGIIDITIKRKDGKSEHFRQHNVIFDILANAYNDILNSQVGTLTGGVSPATCYFSSDVFTDFFLSEESANMTEPEYIPETLVTTSSSSSTWYLAPRTSSITDKRKTVSATWTINQTLTLKSIAFRFKNTTMSNMYYCDRAYLADGNLYGEDTETIRLKVTPTQFSFNKKYCNGFSKDASPNVSSGDWEYAYVPYTLCNPDERFAFTNLEHTAFISTPSSSYNILCIKNKNTNEIIREFPLTQFAGSNTSYAFTFIVNTGTKNYLFQADNTTSETCGLNAWQIPDTATEDNIPLAGNILAGEYFRYSKTSYSICAKVAKNYIALAKGTGSKSYDANPIKIDDDLQVTKYAGYSSDYKWTTYSSSNNNQYYPLKYWDGKTKYYSSSAKNYPNWYDNGNLYYPLPFNVTAANFTTPIVLAAGDVLTITYSIEVA